MKKLLTAIAAASLAMSACASPSGNSPLPEGKAVGPQATSHSLPPDSSLPFSYGVSQFTVQAVDQQEGESGFYIDEHYIPFKLNQIAIELKDEAALPKILKHLGAKVLEQEIVPRGFRTTGSKADGTFRQLPPETLEKRPAYLLEVVTSDADDTSSFGGRAKRADITGKYKFKSNRDVSLLNKILDLKEQFKDDLVAASINGRYSAAAETNEGLNDSTGLMEKSPNTSGFWFAGSFGKSYGANINEYPWGSRTAPGIADGTGVVVAVIDTGFQGNDEPYMPPAVTYKMEWTWNTAIDQSTIKGHMGSTGKEWHGRWVSSLIFGPSGDSKGSLGCAPDAQPLLIHTSMYYWDIKEAIDTARNNGAKVINMSLYGGWSGFWQFVTSSITAAYNENRIMVACTGNDGYDTGVYPAAYSEVMGVAALNLQGQNATSTDWGGTSSSNTANADLWAPGTQVAVIANPGAEGGYSGGNWGRQFRRLNGTSLAAPLVSGVIAACVEQGYLSSANTTSAINFMRTWSYSYPAGRSLNAIYAVE